MATINSLGIPLPGNSTNILHPKQKNRWRVRFANIGNASTSESISLQAISVSRPTVKFGKVEVHRYNSVAYIAGKHSWEPIELVVEDDVTNVTTRSIQQQINKQQWLIGNEGPWLRSAEEGANYKFVVYIDTLNGADVVTETWALSGCWIEEAKYDTLEYAEDKAVQISLTIQFDIAHQIFGGKIAPGLVSGTGAGTGQKRSE
jgi:hypothetical protein